MAKQEIFTAKTVEEAIEAGLAALAVSRDDVEIEVLEEGKKKLFGSTPAQVKLTVKEKRTDGERATEFLKGLFLQLGMSAQPKLVSEEENIVIEIEAETARGIVGRRGEVIDALQILAGAVANTGRKEYRRVVVDYENYRESREETLRHIAEKLAAKAVRIGKRVRLEPMNPYERRIIHSALAENEEVTTRSEGKEPARFVVITPKNFKPYDKNRGGRKFDKDRDRGRDRKFGERKPYPKRDLPEEETPQTSGTSFRSGGSGSGYRKGSFNGFFGTYLGNSREGNETDAADSETPDSEE